LKNYGVPTWIDSAHAIAHNKLMIIDGQTVLTGSFNFTKAAEECNAENLLVIRDAALAVEYQANWNKHLKHASRYKGKAPAKAKTSRRAPGRLWPF
jgi:phosphatidylserine/phosphatidylglycerophosphate/cardiolipin synthase-like enzyme